jgi:hypothetical protein
MPNIIDEGGNDTGIEEQFISGLRSSGGSNNTGNTQFSLGDFLASLTPDYVGGSSAGGGTGAEQPEPEVTWTDQFGTEFKGTYRQMADARGEALKNADLLAAQNRELNQLLKESDPNYKPPNAFDKFIDEITDPFQRAGTKAANTIGKIVDIINISPAGLMGTHFFGDEPKQTGPKPATPPITIGNAGGTTYTASTGVPGLDSLIGGLIYGTPAADTTGGVLTGVLTEIIDKATLPGTAGAIGDAATTIDKNTLAATSCPAGQIRNELGVCVPIAPDVEEPNGPTVTVSLNDQITKWFEDNFGASDKQVRDAMGDKVSVEQVAANRGVSAAEVQRRYNCADKVYAAEHFMECHPPSNKPVDDGRTGLPLDCPKGQTRDASGKCVSTPPSNTPVNDDRPSLPLTVLTPPGTPPQPPKPECPKGQTRNAAGTCVSAPPPPPPPEPECPKGQTRNAAGTCVSAPPPPPPPKTECPEGSHWVSNGPGALDGKCEPNVVVPPPPPPQPPQPPPPSSTGCSDPAYALLHPTECAPTPTTQTVAPEQSYQQVTTTPGDLADIKYLYDVGGESIFAPNMSDYANEDDPITYLSPYSSRNTSPYNSYAGGGKVSEYDIVTEALRLLRGD